MAFGIGVDGVDDDGTTSDQLSGSGAAHESVAQQSGGVRAYTAGRKPMRVSPRGRPAGSKRRSCSVT